RVGALPGKRVVVAGAVEEESTTSRGARHLLGSRQPAMVIIGEPSGWDRITLGYKGRLLADFSLEQPAGHSAGPERTACERAVSFWQAVQDSAALYNSGRERRFETLDASLRAIRSSGDGLRERVEAIIAFRIPPGLDPGAVRQAIDRFCPAEARLRFRGAEVPFRAPKGTPVTRALLAGIRAVGGEPAFSLKTGTSDMNVVGPVWQCPIAAYGPGDSALDHTPDEHLDLAEYEKAIAVLVEALKQLGASTTPGR
ncbi:MAG: M20/M25/M40 family metallo-hydrolase, partial [Anaerolineae bacterium]|nr:M20/M25/M40 family metallo-hydrolase [Anaerolineae bacterium]